MMKLFVLLIQMLPALSRAASILKLGNYLGNSPGVVSTISGQAQLQYNPTHKPLYPLT